ncbi:MAG: T9SS type A sorting domain-containing protein [Bacteroidota bacterium]|nr:T9SS type A sorting domain-containing protein [Bacteroidota bacterium]MDX5431296.1 T9SS type A sorting domain-containing protein [Bacteroidota bacterium]MDX5470034.1 T9SS type A sorting domain-containing protein [Bacteroidota bacterium]
MNIRAGFFIACLFSLGVQAQQQGETLEKGNVRYHVSNTGVLFQNQGAPSFEIPKGSGAHTILSSGLWIGAKDSSGGIRVSIATYDSSGKDFQPGPLDLGNAVPDDPSFWNYTWHVDSGEVATHMSAYNNNGYSAPWSIANWPGSNKRPGNYNQVLAPFIDLDNDFIYEPELGEVPFFKGTEAAYVLFNDKPAFRSNSGSEALGIEVYCLVYTDANLPNVVFVKYRLVNRSFRQYDSLFMGIFTDFMLGNPEDNFTSTDSLRNTYFCYNGLPYDTGFYKDQPPVMGVKFLNTKLSKTIGFNYDENSPQGWPQFPEHYFSYLSGRWKDDTELMDPTSSQTSYLYQGDPCNGSGWTEYGSSGVVAGRRNMLGSTGPYTLKHGESIKLEIAYIFTQSQSDIFANICDFYGQADAVQNYWQGNLSGIIAPEKPLPIRAYPNPSSGILHWNFEEGTIIQKQEWIDLKGRTHTLEPELREMDTRSMTAGIYFLKAIDELGNVYTTKVLVHHP